MGYTPGGGQEMASPSYSDATPPTPDRQGDAAPEGVGRNRTTPTTFESGQPPAARSPIESGWDSLVDVTGLDGDLGPRGGTPEGLRGYRPDPVGGTYNPGQGKR
jgi:hypothetical protein